MQWQDQADEIKIALTGRAKPIFGFITVDEEQVCKVQSAAISKRVAAIRIKGSIDGRRVALFGELLVM